MHDEDEEGVSEEDGKSEGEIVPKEKVKKAQSLSIFFMKWLQYSELEKKIPGLKDGMFKSPADGEWKKVRHLMMIEMSGHWTGDVWYFWWELFEGEEHQ